MDKKEQYRSIPSSVRYEITRDGGAVRYAPPGDDGYIPLVPSLVRWDGRRKRLSVRIGEHWRPVANLVAEAWIGPRPEGCAVVHLDGDWQNNDCGNLAYVSRGRD